MIDESVLLPSDGVEGNSDEPLCMPSPELLKKLSLQVQNQWTGNKWYKIAARDLVIHASLCSNYWKWTSFPESKYPVAELHAVRRLEIYARISTSHLSQKTSYAAYLVYKLTDDSEGFDFHHPPAESYFGKLKGIYYRGPRSTKTLCLVPKEGQVSPNKRPDGWMEVELGDYFVEGEDEQLEMCFRETNGGHWKKGLIVQGIEVRPKQKISD